MHWIKISAFNFFDLFGDVYLVGTTRKTVLTTTARTLQIPLVRTAPRCFNIKNIIKCVRVC